MYKISYTGDGANREFMFVFPFFQNADVRVALDDIVLAPDQYSVLANPDFNGGRVMLANAPAPGVSIDVFRRISLSRVVDYQPTAKIDPEHLNSDFNFLLEVCRDMQAVHSGLDTSPKDSENIMAFLQYTLSLIHDRLSGGGVLGLYNNLLGVLSDALPKLINDYGLITEVAPNENRDDYGVL